jgi:hypothetical protein
MIWLGWTALLAIAAYEFDHSNMFASVNISLPAPVALGVNGHRFNLGTTVAIVAAALWLFLFLYLPPILVTLSWLVARRGVQSESR